MPVARHRGQISFLVAVLPKVDGARGVLGQAQASVLHRHFTATEEVGEPGSRMPDCTGAMTEPSPSIAAEQHSSAVKSVNGANSWVLSSEVAKLLQQG